MANMSDKKLLMLIDGHAMAYRAYHAIPPLTGPTGEPTNAILGFANMLLKSIHDYAPDYVVATFDVGRTFRHDQYPEYKANRAKTPDDLRVQFKRITELTTTLGIPIHAVDTYEADDLLGTLSKQASDYGLETIIVSGDSDTLQLVGPDVKVLMPRRSIGDVVLYDLGTVRKRYELEPAQIIDLKAIVGDSSDNIPGVRGVGAKTATTLLKEYGTLEVIYEHLEDIKQARFRNALAAGSESATLSKSLVTIRRDVGITLNLEASVWGTFDRERVMSLLRELGFHSLVGRIPRTPEHAVPGAGTEQQLGLFGDGRETVPRSEHVPAGVAYDVIATTEDLSTLATKLRSAAQIAIDTETTGTDAMQARLVGLSISEEEGVAHYIPVGHDLSFGDPHQASVQAVVESLGSVFVDDQILKVMHNSKFDIKVLTQHGIPVSGPISDTMIAAWLLSPSGRGIGLKEQAWQRLGVEMTPINELIGAGRKQITMDKVSVARAAPYACADADMTFRLNVALMAELASRRERQLLLELEMPLVPVLVDMEMHGMLLDAEYLALMSREILERLAELTEYVYAQVGHPFNINSTKQLGAVLFEELGLEVVRRTRTGYSTDNGVLDTLKDKHPIVSRIVEYRQLEKLRGTYVDALPALVNPRTGRVHTSFNQTGTSTGRLSSSNPNLQNIPVRTELGRRIRGAFVAPPGHVLLGCDYSQVELRLLAHLSQDPELLGAFHRDEDVHASTAAAVFNVELEAVTSEQRGLAKTINFGLMYGMSEFGLAARTQLSRSEARGFIEAYFGRFRRVKEYLDETVRDARENGYVETIMGRRRYFPELRSRSAARGASRQAAERAAVNMPIQGSAADIIKLAMIRLHRRLQDRGCDARMLLQVHDELVLEVPESQVEATRELVVETMDSAYEIDVPLKVDAAVGHNWMEMKQG